MVLTYVANSLFVVYFPIRQLVLTIQRWRASKQRSVPAGTPARSRSPSQADPLYRLWQREQSQAGPNLLVEERQRHGQTSQVSAGLGLTRMSSSGWHRRTASERRPASCSRRLRMAPQQQRLPRRPRSAGGSACRQRPW